MSLPLQTTPIYTLTIPSSDKKVKFRPFLVKEEKMLLMAKESKNITDIFSSIKQVVNNCIIDKLDVDKLPLYDLEFLFLKLRAYSIDNNIKITYEDFEDKKSYEFNVDLNDVEIVYPDTDTKGNIKITEKAGIVMRYPPATLYDDNEFLALEKDQMFELIVRCIDKIYEGDTVYNVNEYKKEEIVEFLENLDIKTFEAVQMFLINTPKLQYVIKYKNSLGNDRTITLESLNDFFNQA